MYIPVTYKFFNYVYENPSLSQIITEGREGFLLEIFKTKLYGPQAKYSFDDGDGTLISIYLYYVRVLIFTYMYQDGTCIMTNIKFEGIKG